MVILILVSIILISLIFIMIYFHSEDKREKTKYEEEQRKRDEELHRYINDPEYRKKKDEELENNLKAYSTEYSKYDDPYYNSDFPISTQFNTTKDDSFYDITSPSCPYGMWTW